MAKQVGYSFVDLNTGEEIDSSISLPMNINYTIPDIGQPTGFVSLDKVGQEVPDSVNPAYRVVERWSTGNDVIPVDHTFEGYENPVFDGEKVNVTPIYAPIAPEVLAANIKQAEDDQRRRDIEFDTGAVALRDRLKSSTNAQIDSYIQTNVTDLASAKTVLARILKILVKVI